MGQLQLLLLSVCLSIVCCYMFDQGTKLHNFQLTCDALLKIAPKRFSSMVFELEIWK
jgi:hypothetical protein